MHDPAHIDIEISGARPKALAALLRYFRDLDSAEEAFQEACLRALQTWPHKGPPRDPTAWLVTVGRNAALNARRRSRSIGPLPDADALMDTSDELTPERLDESQSRAPARFDANGEIVLLDQQDRSRWNRTLIDEGRLLLERSSVYQNPGPYQLQAAIAALHARATRPEDTLWKEIDSLYQALEALQPSPVVTLNRAVAVWKLQGPEAALEMIDPLRKELDAYFYLHGLRGTLLKELSRLDEARDALNRAISLANSIAEAKLIRRELDTISVSALKPL